MQRAQYAIKYEYKLKPNDVCKLYLDNYEIYDELDDQLYGSDKLVCSIFYQDDDEYNRLLKMGFQSSHGTLDRLLDYLVDSPSASTTFDEYVDEVNTYKPYFGAAFPSPTQIENMILLRLNNRKKIYL